MDKQCWAGNLANADKWNRKIAFAILVDHQILVVPAESGPSLVLEKEQVTE